MGYQNHTAAVQCQGFAGMAIALHPLKPSLQQPIPQLGVGKQVNEELEFPHPALWKDDPLILGAAGQDVVAVAVNQIVPLPFGDGTA